MARQPRNELGDGVFHATNRGVARTTLFHDSGDYVEFSMLLCEVARRCEWELHAHCLMPNHYHVIVGASQPSLSSGMQRLNGLFAQSFNHRYGRVGHLFQNRFGARLIESDEYLEAACTYVVANPVRSSLCERPEDWPWSSAR